VERSNTYSIFPAQSDKELTHIRQLFREYAAQLGIPLDFQNFEDELAALPGKYAPPRVSFTSHGWMMNRLAVSVLPHER
jgi:hypothetical protein